MKNNKGFTLIELLAVIVILAVIALIATPIILGLIDDAKKNSFKASAYGISGAAKNAFVEIMYAGSEPKDITYTYTDGVETSSPSGYNLNYEGEKPKNGQVILTKEGKVSLLLHNGKYCATKNLTDAEIIIEEKSVDDCLPPIDVSGANVPLLAQGMTAVIWDGTSSSWIAASDINNAYKQNWYDYANKKWANAQTADGSMWVWIPRYAYQITTGYHTSTEGTIDIKFLKGITNTTKDNTTIYTDNATNSHFVKHPAFTFGTTEVTGFWVAKFETSGSTASLDSKPGVSSLKNTTVGNMFTSSRNMETNNRYGWNLASTLQANGIFTTDTNGVDTHMVKNIEWGATAYLAQSTYGKATEITINDSSSYYTGGGTGNAYVTNVGQSTTGNIYGIYDMSGGSREYVMGNYNNTAGSAGLTPANINDRYIDRYTAYDNTKYGDAVYETSSTNTSTNSWYADFSTTPDTSVPWFLRSGLYTGGTGAGAFSFFRNDGAVAINYSWRIAILVNSGL